MQKLHWGKCLWGAMGREPGEAQRALKLRCRSCPCEGEREERKWEEHPQVCNLPLPTGGRLRRSPGIVEAQVAVKGFRVS